MPAPTLEGQMLCASVYSYAVQSNGSFSSSYPPYDSASGLIAPVAIVGGAGKPHVDACLVGRSSALNAVVVAFRGTLPPTERGMAPALDWMNDFHAELISVPGIPGALHAGFWGSLDALWSRLLPQVRALRQAGDKTLPLYLTGHNKGGAMATLAAMRFARLEGIEPAGIFTFAAPKCGDVGFAKAYPFHNIHQRFEFQDDAVPHLPPSTSLLELLRQVPDIGKRFQALMHWNYTPVGTLRFIHWDHQVRGESPELEVERTHHLLRLMAELQFGTILKAHGADCGDGYMTAINPTGVCAVSKPVDVAGLMAARGHQVSDAVKDAFEKRKLFQAK
ncbi:MAG: lipase family protein [Hyalangium sp.]|uniref:lipase family protein n=1 Tax=Hyalangium sp. TaxID=2028555 RepID=UPI003899BC51